MAWDLDPWSSSFDKVASDDSYCEQPEWQCSLYFGHERDVIEEDSLNEESCIQVLKILITKADTEIEGLEKDLLSLQNELAWAEYEKWPEICCGALTERINLLDVAINTLKKNDHADDSEVHLLHKPAETVHEIVEALQRYHFEDIHGQNLIKERSFKMIIKVEENHESTTPVSTQVENELLSLTWELKENKHLEMVVFNPVLNDAEHALDKDCSSVDSNIIIKEEGKELCGTSELLLELHDKRSNEEKLHEKRSNDPEKIQELVAKSLVTSPDLGAISCAPDDSEEMKLSGTSDNEVSENEVRSQLIATGIKGGKRYLYSRVSASQYQESENHDFDRKLCDLAHKPARKACKKGSKIVPAEDLDSMKLALQVVYPQGLCLADTELCSFKGSHGNKSQEMMNIENTSLIHAENSAFISLLEKSTQSTLFPGLQLIDEERQSPQGVKSKIVANLKKSNMSFPSKLKAQGKRKAESEAHDSPTEVDPNTRIVVSTKRQRTNTGTASLNDPMNRKITKKAAQPSPDATEGCAIVPYISETHDNPTEVDPSSPIVVSTKGLWKSKTSTGSATLNESMNRKFAERVVHPGPDATEGRAIVPYNSEFSELQKRRVSKWPITAEIQNSAVNLELPNPDRDSMDNGSQVDLHIVESYSLEDSHNETTASQLITLKKLNLTALKDMAKQYNVKKYYKLRKAELLQQLLERMSNC